jgi:Uma2 family endonuclease
MSTASSTPLTGNEIPPLVNGDRLTRAEFRRRWEAMPHIKKAELIDGVVYMAAAVRHREHGLPHSNVMGWLWSYRLATPGIGLGDNSTVEMPADNDPQPDAYLTLPVALGGNVQETEDGYLEGPPDLIVEVAAASERLDLGDKFRLYERTGVTEYVVFRTESKIIDWFVLEDNRYVPLASEDGIFQSRRFPGLWLGMEAMIAGDDQGIYRVLQQGLATPEHAAFKAELARRERG